MEILIGIPNGMRFLKSVLPMPAFEGSKLDSVSGQLVCLHRLASGRGLVLIRSPC